MSDAVTGPRPVFLVEAFAPAAGEHASSGVARRVSAVCADLHADGADVGYLGALIVPDDELAFHIFSAAEADVVLEACGLAGLLVERVVPSVAFCAHGALPSSRQALPIAVQPEGSLADEPCEIRPRSDPQL